MAEKKPSAAVRSHSRVRRSATHSGVTHIRQYQPDRYTIIGNHLAQHRELSLTAIGVGTHILSLPEGASVDIRSLAARFPEGATGSPSRCGSWWPMATWSGCGNAGPVGM